MYDLVDHHPLKQLLADFDAQMKPIAAVCHGVVGLIHVRRAHATNSLIHGRMLTGFSQEEEMSTGGEEENPGNKHPFVLEVRLKEQGALYTKGRPAKEHVVQDGLLLTGQNPASAKQFDSSHILRGMKNYYTDIQLRKPVAGHHVVLVGCVRMRKKPRGRDSISAWHRSMIAMTKVTTRRRSPGVATSAGMQVRQTNSCRASRTSGADFSGWCSSF